MMSQVHVHKQGSGWLVSATSLPSLGFMHGKSLYFHSGFSPSGCSKAQLVKRADCQVSGKIRRLGVREMNVTMSSSGRSRGPKVTTSDNSVPLAATAREAVESGLALFAKGRVRDALSQFDAALAMNPSPEEAQAALYNKACCHANRQEGEKAAKALRQALGEYGLKFSVILNDADMAAFRAMPEFQQLQNEARKGGEEVGSGFRRDLKLISEVQAPFRGVRKFLYLAFTVAAGISTLFTIPRFIPAIQGREGAPDLIGTSQNLAINLAGIAVFVALYIWDSKKEEEQLARISRDETLSRLPLRLQSDRVTELGKIRDTTRPVIIAGPKEDVTKALQQAQRYREDLVKRGVLVIPIIWSSDQPELLKKRGFGSSEREKPLSQASSSADGDDFEKRAADVAARAVIQAERRFKAEAVSQAQWERWIKDQQQSEGVTVGSDVYIVLRLDGRIRKSGRGMPDWQDLIRELPPLDALVSKLER